MFQIDLHRIAKILETILYNMLRKSCSAIVMVWADFYQQGLLAASFFIYMSH